MKLGLVARMAVALLAGGAPVAAQAYSFGYILTYEVPVMCAISYQNGGAGAGDGQAVGLGALHEYCNAPRGYQLVVQYAPGTMNGAVLIAGDDRVTLDGSGYTVVGRSSIPRMRELPLSAIPGANGFDTDRLDFNLVAG